MGKDDKDVTLKSFLKVDKVAEAAKKIASEAGPTYRKMFGYPNGKKPENEK